MILYEALVGSRCYGTAGPDSDYDYVRVVLDTPESVLAIDSEVGERGAHVHGEDDTATFSLRRFASLVAKGNPNLITALCAPEYNYDGPQAVAIRSLLGAVYCQQTVRQYTGMALAQIRKYRAGALAAGRAPLIEKYGYDTKFVYHVLRLDDEVHQFIETGRVRYPLAAAELLVEVRNGRYLWEEVDDVLTDVEASLKRSEVRAAAEMVTSPDTARINEIVLGIYEESWGLGEGTLTDRAKVSH